MILTYDVQKLVPTRLDPCLSFFFLCTLPDIVREVEFTTCFERERESAPPQTDFPIHDSP